ncbi:hypothetical protein [Ignavibacterium album]|uniref:hypothetical protein n=1 Tax=Ignavibacterium album TaxID=591197 RepID=UPI0035B99CDF
MKSSAEILPLLLNPECPKSRRQLIEISYKIALSYITFNHRRVKKILISEEISPKEFALEAIAPLFESDDKNRFIIINKTFQQWNPPVTTESEAQFFLNKLVQMKTEQHISKLLRQADPFFSRLLDKLNYHIKKNGYKKLRYLGTVYIVPSESNEIKGRIIREDEFYQIPGLLFNFNNKILQKIFAYIEKETEFADAIPLNLLILRIKDAEVSSFETDNNTSDFIEESNVEKVLENALRITLSKLNESYFKKGKLSSEEIMLFEKTLNDIIIDMKDGGVNPGLYKYLMANDNRITIELYEQKYRNILEYIYKLLKKNIAALLRV